MAFILTGGGARAAYQLGVLKYIFSELGYEPKSPIFVGSSAGGINAFYLAMRAHVGYSQAINELCDLWSELTIHDIYKTDLWSVLKTIGNFAYNFTFGRYVKKRHIESILDSTPLYFFLRNRFDQCRHELHANIQSGKVAALGLTAMQYGTGKNVTFYEATPGDGGDDVHPWHRTRREGRPTKLRLKHILASAAIPLLFPSVKVENNYYGDGSVRKSAPLSPAIQLGATKIFAIGLRPAHFKSNPIQTYPSLSQIVGMMLNTVFLDALDDDVHNLERINQFVKKKPDTEGLREIDVKLIRPSNDLGLLALPFKHFIPKSLAFLVKGMGPTDRRGADFLSYILFDKHYIRAMIDEGFASAHAEANELKAFFSSLPKEKVA